MTFQHDNATPDKTNDVKQVLQRNGIKNVYQLYNSPDLNALDLKINSYLASAVERENPKNREDLVNCVKKAWRKMPVSQVFEAIDMQRDMCQKIITAKGGNHFVG